MVKGRRRWRRERFIKGFHKKMKMFIEHDIFVNLGGYVSLVRNMF